MAKASFPQSPLVRRATVATLVLRVHRVPIGSSLSNDHAVSLLIKAAGSYN